MQNPGKPTLETEAMQKTTKNSDKRLGNVPIIQTTQALTKHEECCQILAEMTHIDLNFLKLKAFNDKAHLPQ